MNIPEWAQWQSLDSVGRRWLWSEKPVLEDYHGRKIWGMLPGTRCECLTLGGPIPNDWTQTLEVVK